MIIRRWVCRFDFPCTEAWPHMSYSGCYSEIVGYRCEGCDLMVDSYMAPDAKRWFFTRRNQCWCPRHIPAWVEGWRASQKAAPDPE
jgi:hypothetical protein